MTRFLELQPSVFESCFGVRPFMVRHHLTKHALFNLPRILELARRLPERSVEYNAGDVPLTLDPSHTPRTGLSVEKTIRRISECQSWMVLKNIEQDPAYANLLDECLAQVHGLSAHLTPGMRDREAFIFLSSPGSLTPYHMDPEQNFLLQIRGEKTIHVFDPADRTVLSQQEIERFCSGAHRNLVFREEYQNRAEEFVLTPGRGVHVPVLAPHWVRNGPEVSISFSITFQTNLSLRNRHVHAFNAGLRRLGLAPAPAGRSALADRIKQFAFRAKDRTARVFQRAD